MANPYSFMHQLGIGGEAIVRHNDSGSIDISFLVNELLAEGTIVKMTTVDMTVVKNAALADIPVGVVVNCEDKVDRKIAVVKTYFAQIVRATAFGGTLVAGSEVNAVAVDGTSGLMQYATASSTHRVVGKVLVGATVTNDVLIGLYRVPLIPNTTS